MKYLVTTEDRFNLRTGDVVATMPDSYQFGGKDLEGCRVVSLPNEDSSMLENRLVPNPAYPNSNPIRLVDTKKRTFYFTINNIKERR